MPSVWVLGASQVAVSGGGSLSGITQGDGSHLVGRTITLSAPGWTEALITDNDAAFDDNDTGQRLAQPLTLGGTTFAANAVVEAEYRLTLRDPATGQTWDVIGFNVNNSSPAYGTIEGLAFIGPPQGWPPVGRALTVSGAREGPGSSGQPTITYPSLVVPCFTPGARILTPGGERPVEDLAPGDMVVTRDAGAQPVRLVARTELSPARLAIAPRLAPVRIAAGALGGAAGPAVPRRDLVLSPQHRVLMEGAANECLFGARQVLVAAADLVGRPGVSRERVRAGGVEYLHLLLDGHHIVMAEGMAVESLLPGPALMRQGPPALADEIAALFPALAAADRTWPAARPCLRPWEARLAAA